MIAEHVERRVLAGIRFLDATTALPVTAPLVVSGDGLRVVPGRRDIHVIAGARGLEAYTESFAPPAAPAPGSITAVLRVEDRSGVYLARRLSLRLPRDPDPERADEPDSLFRPVDVLLFPSPIAGVGRGWAVVRARVRFGDDAATAVEAPGALLRVLRSGTNARLALGMADGRGEALVGVPGIPITTFGAEEDAPVLATEIDVLVQAVFDPEAGPEPDPDLIEARRVQLPSVSVAARLASGRGLSMSLLVPAP